MVKVYVSSTIADLRRERQAVVDWLVAAGPSPHHARATGAAVLASRRVMEKFGENARRPR